MPISRENAKRYPKNWREISAGIRARAFDRCECEGECGIDHFKEDAEVDDPIIPSERCWARNGLLHPVTIARVVLTVAHLDHTPENCTPENLRAMCQRCHNRYDKPHRMANAARTRRVRKASGDLFVEATR